MLAENRGEKLNKASLTRLRRGQGSQPREDLSSEDDLDMGSAIPRVQDIQSIWDDEKGAADEDDDMDDLEGFIEEEMDAVAGEMDDAEREEKREERRRQDRARKKALGSRPADALGIDAV